MVIMLAPPVSRRAAPPAAPRITLASLLYLLYRASSRLLSASTASSSTTELSTIRRNCRTPHPLAWARRCLSRLCTASSTCAELSGCGGGGG